MTAAGASDVGHLPRIGTLLGVWTHRQEAVYLSSGLMARVRNHGGRVVVVTAADDGQTAPPAGAYEHHRLRHCLGELGGIPVAAGAAELLPVLADVQPDVVVTFGPDGAGGSDDQRAVSAWTTEAWHRSGRRAGLWYAALDPEDHPAVAVRLTRPLLAGKIRAMRAYPPRSLVPDRAWWSTESFVAAGWGVEEEGLTGT
jgi:LmbE family N-acetylglucosaminyl deacetylase